MAVAHPTRHACEAFDPGRREDERHPPVRGRDKPSRPYHHRPGPDQAVTMGPLRVDIVTHPGILHAWRHDSDGWQARCTYVVDDGTPEGVTITQWLAATAIRPA